MRDLLRHRLASGDTLGLLDAEFLVEPLAKGLRDTLDRREPLGAQLTKLPHDAADRLFDTLGSRLAFACPLGLGLAFAFRPLGVLLFSCAPITGLAQCLAESFQLDRSFARVRVLDGAVQQLGIVGVDARAFLPREMAAERTVGKTVLGHHPEYTKLAGELGARCFNIPTNVWNKMTDAERWAANQKFLDRMINRGDDIILATPLDKVKSGSYFQRELDYLFGKGYKVSPDGTKLVSGGG